MPTAVEKCSCNPTPCSGSIKPLDASTPRPLDVRCSTPTSDSHIVSRLTFFLALFMAGTSFWR